MTSSRNAQKTSPAQAAAKPSPVLAERLLSLAERSAKAGSWSWNVVTGEIFWSPGMYALFQLDSDKDPAGFDSWRARVHPDDRDIAELRTAEAIQNRSYLFNQYRIVWPEGQIRWIDAYGDLTLDDSGAVELMSGFCIDATNRIELESEKNALGSHLEQTRQLKEDLAKSQERLGLALSGSSLAMWDWDITGHKVFGGDGWSKILGHEPNALGETEEDWLAMIHHDDIARFQQVMESTLNGNDAIFESEHRLRHKDGHWVHVEARGKVSHRTSNGEPVRMVGTVLDITLRKRLNVEGKDLLNRIAALIADTTAGSTPAPHSSVDSDILSRRQRQTLAMIAKGLTTAEIARQMNISTATAIDHRRKLMKKLGLHNTADVTRFALANGLLDGLVPIKTNTPPI